MVIVGAGQAGCAAAYDLACAGLSVCLLDRYLDTSHKPCAGGVTEKARRLYRFPLDSVIREQVSALQMSLWLRRETRFAAASPVCVMTHRPELDALCRQQAERVGTLFRQIKGLSGLHYEADGVLLQTREGDLRCRWLIGADGANSTVRRLAFGGGAGSGGMAIEGLLAREHCSHYPPTRFDFGVVKDGYGWLFPKGDHVNVGLYIRRARDAVVTRNALADYARRRLGSDALTNVQGFPLGTWAHQRLAAAGRVLLVGDAAGFVEPLLGEGIYGAVLSGQYAAAAILSGQDQSAEAVVATYLNDIERWRRELAGIHPLAAVFYKTLPLSYGALYHAVRRPLMDGAAEGLTLGQSKRRFFGAHFS
ncbi:MAG: FAD-dependent oxidoreductase [Gammaproteobacteria bacterium HGW-Gammaproteobacteria-14]|nr:MAG: FAD-dependent oxidoreductase [Gammaproteobacteria bacterium HGW-Gammaproteobacteria-14]